LNSIFKKKKQISIPSITVELKQIFYSYFRCESIGEIAIIILIFLFLWKKKSQEKKRRTNEWQKGKEKGKKFFRCHDSWSQFIVSMSQEIIKVQCSHYQSHVQVTTLWVFCFHDDFSPDEILSMANSWFDLIWFQSFFQFFFTIFISFNLSAGFWEEDYLIFSSICCSVLCLDWVASSLTKFPKKDLCFGKRTAPTPINLFSSVIAQSFRTLLSPPGTHSICFVLSEGILTSLVLDSEYPNIQFIFSFVFFIIFVLILLSRIWIWILVQSVQFTIRHSES